MPPTFFFFFFNDTATTEIYTLSLHDALPISPESLREARRPEPGGAAPPAGAGSRPREEAGDRCEAPRPQGPSRLVRRGRPKAPGEAGRAPGEGEGPDRDEAEAPRLRHRGRRHGAALPEAARLPDGDAAADRLPDVERGKRVARRTQGIDETPQATRDPQVGPRQDCERDQGHRLWDHGVFSGRGEGARDGRRAQREGALGPRGDRRNRPSDRRPDPRWQ